MDSRDDASSNGDETLDWLWDLDDRYDVGGIDEDPTGGFATVSGAGSGVKKHLRKQRVRVGDAAPLPDEAGDDDAGEATAAVAMPFRAAHGPRSSWRDRLIRDGRVTSGGIAAALLLVLALGGVVYALSDRGGGSTHPGNRIAISPTTDTTIPTDTTIQPPTSDTTTTAATPTTGVAAVTPTGTTVYSSPYVPTTVSYCRRGRLLAAIVQADGGITTTTVASSTTTTEAPTTIVPITTTTSVAPTTTVPPTVATTSPPPTVHGTVPPATNPPPRIC